MAQIQVVGKIRGMKQLIHKLNRIQGQISADSGGGLIESLKIIRDGAITNLNGQIGTGRWGPWGKSVVDKSIRDKGTWVPSLESMTRFSTKAKMEVLSEHAAVVEFGSIGAAMVERTTPFPIGKQQGLEPIFRPRFAVQRGYHYLTSTIHNTSIHNAITNKMAETVRNSILKHI